MAPVDDKTTPGNKQALADEPTTPDAGATLAAVGEVLLGRYRVERIISVASGQGEVYKAFDQKMHRPVALKLLKLAAHGTDRAAAVERFQREARVLAALSHPGITTVFDVETLPHPVVGDTPMMAMEFLPGKSLAEVMKFNRQPLPWREAFRIIADAAEGLAKAHQHENATIIHRDIKPANLFLCDDGRVKVLDFGIASVLDEISNTGGRAAHLTGVNHVLGTAPYMSPEQLDAQELDGRSDVYSLGAVLYLLVTGCRAWKYNTVVEMAAAVNKRGERPVDVKDLVPRLDEAVAAVIRRAMASDRDKRFQSMGEFRSALRRAMQTVPFADDEEAPTSTYVPREPDVHSIVSADIVRETNKDAGVQRRRWPLVGIVAVVVIVASIGGWWLLRASSSLPLVPTIVEPAQSAPVPVRGGGALPSASAPTGSPSPPVSTPVAAEPMQPASPPAEGVAAESDAALRPGINNHHHRPAHRKPIDSPKDTRDTAAGARTMPGAANRAQQLPADAKGPPKQSPGSKPKSLPAGDFTLNPFEGQ